MPHLDLRRAQTVTERLSQRAFERAGLTVELSAGPVLDRDGFVAEARG